MLAGSEAPDDYGGGGRPSMDDNQRRSRAVGSLFGANKPTQPFSSDVESMKSNVKERLHQRDRRHSVREFYHKEGLAQRIATSPIFENLTLAVIAFNAVWIAVDTDWNRAHTLLTSDALFQIMEHFFCSYFTFEWIVRFLSFQRKLDGLKDAWFIFDSTLLVLMVLETWIFTAMEALSGAESPLGSQAQLLRLFRLLRLTRLLRMLRSVPELMILVKAMVTAMKSVAYVMCLLVILVYVFAIAATQLTTDSDLGYTYFDNVLLSMYTLAIYGTFLDELSSIFSDMLASRNWPVFALFLIFLGLSALTVMNMLIGVLCEVVSEVADKEKQDIMASVLAEKFKAIVDELDSNNDGMISEKEFMSLLQSPVALSALEDVGIDPLSLTDFADAFFYKDGVPDELEFGTFMEKVLELRGSNTATVKDIMNFTSRSNAKHLALSKEMSQVKAKTTKIQHTIRRMEGQMKALTKFSRNKGRYSISEGS